MIRQLFDRLGGLALHIPEHLLQFCLHQGQQICSESTDPICRPAFLSSFHLHSLNSSLLRAFDARAGLQLMGNRLIIRLHSRQFQIKNRAIRRPRKKYGGAPFNVVPLGKDRCPGLDQRSIYGIAASQSAIKLASETDRRLVGDGKMHRHHRRNALQYQVLRRAGIRIGLRSARPFTGIQYYQAQR